MQDIFCTGRKNTHPPLPYPFLNINTLGWPRTVLNTAVIAILFLITSWLFVGLDSLLARRRTTTLSG
jgi:hypothetical protein